MHSSYSPNLRSSDYQLFLCMVNDLASVGMASRGGCESRLCQCFDNGDENFYETVKVAFKMAKSYQKNSVVMKWITCY